MKLIVGLLFLVNAYAFAMGANCSYTDGIDNGLFENFKAIRPLLEKIENRNFDPCQQEISPPTSKKELCQMSMRNFQTLMCQNSNRLSFNNQGGLFGLPTGLCWWISKFHRQATYLSHYCEDCEKPDFTTKAGKKHLRKIFNSIIRQKGTVEIPGYANLREFTADPVVKKALIKRLQRWMAGDTFLRMQWTKSFKGKTGEINFGEHFVADYATLKKAKFSPLQGKKAEKMIQGQNEEIKKIFEQVNQEDKISYIMLQTPSLTAHSAVIFDAKKLKDDNGEDMYVFKVQDSSYQNGADHSLKYTFQQRNYTTMIYKSGHWYHSPHHDASQSPEAQLFFSQDYNIYSQYDKRQEKLQKKLELDCSEFK